ncbi:hypothetical protein RhiirA5_469358 [Rhizophagus irregularis]|uniref:MATA-HMG n=1 Tax=Rhizophagus irregularis TaxID=588596 RepID=A0A1B1EUL8_9GLOM|nr:MATA-HMG [Rhizophagus irregularis]ANQ32508.1 MATA-HMG [Rhizophagus irregularis]PKC16765.1 hypothetical protein RhiirA5_469358 [Rhizophagus irregularis]PKY24453.1 hypothetical protein RhiirB3_527219 [Rhizophagus irregularis]CAB5110679.1 unnamed protein product [Rhizophagus irregularis]
MAEIKFSTDFLATSLIEKLNRKNIFPPLFNDPESFVPTGRSRKPSNSFLICRRNVCKEAKGKGTYNMRVISKAAALLWNNATFEEKKVYKTIAKRVNEIHEIRKLTFNFKVKLTAQPPRAPSISHQLHLPPISSILSSMFETLPDSDQSNTGTQFI